MIDKYESAQIAKLEQNNKIIANCQHFFILYGENEVKLFAIVALFVYIFLAIFIPVEGEGSKLIKKKKIRILLAKPGLDGHDRGAKVVAYALLEAGFEVIYTGLHQSPEQIVQAALHEDPDVIGLSILSGAHIPICEKLIKIMRAKNLHDISIAIGGVIPDQDKPKLRKMGVSAIFTAGAKFENITEEIERIARKDQC